MPPATPEAQVEKGGSQPAHRPTVATKRRTAPPPKQSVAPRRNATSLPPERRTGRPRGIQAETAQGPALAVVRGGKTLGVRPAEILPADEERWAEACRALRVLYRDFLAGGGLDVLRDRRSHATPASDARQRRAA